MRGRRLAVVAAFGLVLAAAVVLSSVLSSARVSEQRSRALFDDRARVVARAWSDPAVQERWRASVVALEPPTREPAWGSREDLRNGLRGGWGRVAAPLPHGPGQAQVQFPDGSRTAAPVVSAQTALDQALQEIRLACASGCGEPVVTSARLTTMTLRTGRGDVTVPAWAYSVGGIREPLLRVAVPLTEPSDLRPALPRQPRTVPRPVPATREVSRSGRRLTVTVEVPSCSRDVHLFVRETSRVVVVGGTVGRPSGRPCAAVMRELERTFVLSAPVGDRPVVTVTGDLVLPGKAFEPPTLAR